MKKCLLIAAIAASVYNPVYGADFYTSTPVATVNSVAQYVYGPYVGMAFGGQFDYQTVQAVFSPFSSDITKAAGNTAISGIAYGGYDYLFSQTNPIVVGAWVEGNLANGSMNIEGVKISAQGGFAAGGRIGYYISPIFMPYVTGGYTYSTYTTNTVGSGLNNLTGETAGFGAELALTSNLWIKAEYRHDWYDSTRLASSPLSVETLRDTLNANKVEIGIHYKFGGYTPLSMKDVTYKN